MSPIVFALLAVLGAPAHAQSQDDHARDTCRFMIDQILPDQASSLPELELRQFAELRLVKYFSRSKAENARALRDKMREAAFRTTLDILNRELDAKTGEAPDRNGIIRRFLDDSGFSRAEKKDYLARLGNEVESRNTLHQISPRGMAVVRDLDLPFFRGGTGLQNFFDQSSLRSQGGGLSFAQAADVADALAHGRDFQREDVDFEAGRERRIYPDMESRSPPDYTLQEYEPLARHIGMDASGLAILADNLADSLLKNPPGEALEPGSKNNRSYSGIILVSQILRSAGRVDRAELLENMIEQSRRKIHDYNVWSNTTGNNPKEVAAYKRDFERSMTIMSIRDKEKSAPERYARLAGELIDKMETDFRDTRLSFLVSDLSEERRPDLGVYYANQIKDPNARHHAYLSLANGFRVLGDKDQSLFYSNRAALDIDDPTSTEPDVVRSWAGVLESQIDLDPGLAWSITLPAAVGSLNRNAEPSAWRSHKSGLPMPNLPKKPDWVARQEMLEKVLSQGMDRFFSPLKRRDPEGHPRFDGDAALTAAASFKDPTESLAANLAICSIVLSELRENKKKDIPESYDSWFTPPQPEEASSAR